MTSDVFELPESLSRRGFLRLSATGLMAMALPVHWLRPEFELPAGQLGRVADPTVELFSRPSFSSRKLATLWRDDLLTLNGAALGDKFPEHNRIWYMVKDRGFVHSSSIQPVRNEPNKPYYGVPYQGMLMQVTVPYVDAFWKPKSTADKAYRFYYGSTFWVNGISQDVKEHKWYRILDDKWDYRYYARSEAFRPVPISELTPISPEVPSSAKRIVVDLANQWVQCFEGSEMVMTTRISSGRRFDDGSFWTPEGGFVTFRKRGSRHMAAGNLATGYDLPGVPWVCYITDNGVSFHGTYWHNDFGTPRSHGCVNMTPAASKWLYRWTTPVVPAEDQEVWVSYGTEVNIHA